MQGRQESAADMGANETHLRRGGVEYKAHVCSIVTSYFERCQPSRSY